MINEKLKDGEEIRRCLNNKELEEKLYELTVIVKMCVRCSTNNIGPNLMRTLVERLDKIQENLL